MLVELTGCSSAGKSTIIDALLANRVGKSGEQTALELIRLGRLVGTPMSVPVCEMLSMYGWLRFRRERKVFHSAARKAAMAFPSGTRTRERANRIRNAWRHTFLFLVLRRHADPSELVLIDTGPVHTVHNFFIHTNVSPNVVAVNRYLEAMPRADLTLVVQASREALISRTLERTHRRVADGDRGEAESFVDHSLEVFGEIERTLAPLSPVASIESGCSIADIEALIRRSSL